MLPLVLVVGAVELAGLVAFAMIDLETEANGSETWPAHRKAILEATQPKARAQSARSPAASPARTAVAAAPETAAKPPAPPEPKAAEVKPAAPVRQATTGRLTLDTNPWTQVFLRGRKLGDTPLVEVALPVGHQTLQLKNAEKGIDQPLDVEIRPGRTTEKNLNL